MKICLLEDFFRPYSSGGASEYVIRLADSLAQAGHKVSVISTAPTGVKRTAVEYDGPIQVFRVPTRLANIPVYTKRISAWGRLPSLVLYWFNPWTYREVRRILREVQPDVVHTFDALYLSLGALVAVRQSKIPWAHSLLYVNLIKPTGLSWQGPGQPRIGWWSLFLPLARWLVRSPNLIISPSQFSLSIHQRFGFFPQSKTAVVGLGPMHDITSSPHPTDGPVQFLSVGRMNTEKGTLIILDAFLNYHHPNARLVIVGRGSDEAKIRAKAQADNRVTVLGHLSSEELAAVFSRSNVYISASVALETFNLTICEAFHAGLPVIASNVGAQPELLTADCGQVVEPRNVDALTKAIARYVENRSLLQAHASAALERSQNFTFPKNVERTMALYTGLVVRQI